MLFWCTTPNSVPVRSHLTNIHRNLNSYEEMVQQIVLLRYIATDSGWKSRLDVHRERQERDIITQVTKGSSPKAQRNSTRAFVAIGERSCIMMKTVIA